MLIELKEVGYAYLAKSPAATQTLMDITFRIGEGEFVALIGPTGSGKTTLAGIMAGLTRPSSGTVVLGGAQVGFVFQQPERQLFEATVADDIAFWPRNRRLAHDETARRVRAAMEAVGLEYDRYADRSPFSLSGGEMRRAAIAGILVMEPSLLILDEPTAGLDPRGKRDLLGRIACLNRAGTAIVMITHDMDDVAELASRVLKLERGRLIADGAPRTVFDWRGALPDDALPTAPRIARLLNARGRALTSACLTLAELEESICAGDLLKGTAL